MTFLDLYPNVLSLKRVSADYRHIPVFNIVVVALLLGLVGFVYFRVRRFRKRRERKRADA
jgi:Ca2+/Na+ antiporter